MTQYMTSQRKLLYEFLGHHADRKFTAKQIAEALSGEKISLSAVYRNLSALEQDGLINRSVKDGSREILFQYVFTEHCRDKIHLTCTSCGDSFHMDTTGAEQLKEELEKTLGFEINKSKTVLYGVCRKCSEDKEKI